MKKMQQAGMALILFALTVTAVAQTDSVDVTFYYTPQGTPSVVFVPGEFNNWGPNSAGSIAANAPSRMDYDAAARRWYKTIRLRVGGKPGGGVAGAYQYKFNENGTPGGWLPDPLNPRNNPADNNNSILYVTNPTIYHLIPNTATPPAEQEKPVISAYIFPATGTQVDTAALRLVVDSTEYSGLGTYFDPQQNLLSFPVPDALENGTHKVVLHAATLTGSRSADSTTFRLLVAPQPQIRDLPAGVRDGINYNADGSVTLVLFAPGKDYVHVIGEFNNWEVGRDWLMHLTPDSSRFWLTLSGLDPDYEYAFQYLVEGELAIADPYTEKVLDPWNDRYISSSTYPGLKKYPSGNVSGIVSTLYINRPDYEWQTQDFKRRPVEELVVYKLLVRDFIKAHSFRVLADTLDYLQNLGINVIELLPVNEFEGNSSWGYNPSFYFAVDKYYGPAQDFKYFIDQAHARGIAVTMDIVLNHSFGQSPLVQLYFGSDGKPTADNPWYNREHNFANPAAHWGYDFNHESPATQAFVDSVTHYWISEYRIDGFRFDFTKGFTNAYKSMSDPWGSRYDQSRIDILKRMAAKIRSYAPDAYLVLEHLADNDEEKVLADAGLLLWGNMNVPYSQSAMGWLQDQARSSDLSWGFYQKRGWSKPGLVTYMESHDEPWLMYKNLQYGRSSGDYSIKELETALDRIKLVAAFFLTLPGPKMMWQFGELGYDQELPESGGGRTAPKPILWNYYQQPARLRLYKVYQALLKLRRENEVFRSTETQVSMRVGQGQYDRRIILRHPDMDVTIIGNFHVQPLNVIPNFPRTGTWYNYFAGDSIEVTNPNEAIPLLPGEFHIFTTKKLPTPETGLVVSDVAVAGSGPHTFRLYDAWPNPFNPETRISFDLDLSSKVSLKILDLLGREVRTLLQGRQQPGSFNLRWDGRDARGRDLPSGIYLISLQAGSRHLVKKVTLLR